MRGAEFLDVGKPLAHRQLPNCSAEAQYRTAIGRAYYAAFLSIRDTITNTEKRITYPNTADSHKRLCYDINNCGRGEAGVYANMIGDLRDRRNAADYDTDSAVNESDAEFAIELAEACMTWFSVPGQASSIAAGVLIYRAKINQL